MHCIPFLASHREISRLPPKIASVELYGDFCSIHIEKKVCQSDPLLKHRPSCNCTVTVRKSKVPVAVHGFRLLKGHITWRHPLSRISLSTCNYKERRISACCVMISPFCVSQKHFTFKFQTCNFLETSCRFSLRRGICQAILYRDIVRHNRATATDMC